MLFRPLHGDLWDDKELFYMTANVLNYEQHGARQVAQEKLAAESEDFLRTITTGDAAPPMVVHAN